MDYQHKAMTSSKKNPFDVYALYARAFPALISALPLFVLWYFLSDVGDLSALLEYILSLRFLGTITFGAIFLYLYSQLIRTVSKAVEARCFLGRRGFPTTYLLLYEDDSYSIRYKTEFRTRAERTFGIPLPTEKDERANPDEAKRRLHEIRKHVILHIGEGYLVLKHNIWYGFFRNLVGGAIFASILSVLNICVGIVALRSTTLWATSTVLLICFVFIVVWRKSILTEHGESYARQLIAEFMERTKD